MPLYIVETDESTPDDLKWGTVRVIAASSFGTPRLLATETLIEATPEQAEVLQQQGIMVRLAERGQFCGECESGPCTVTIHPNGSYTVTEGKGKGDHD